MRFWRTNSILALRMMQPAAPPADPEEQAQQQRDAAELRQHLAREALVRGRDERLKARHFNFSLLAAVVILLWTASAQTGGVAKA